MSRVAIKVVREGWLTCAISVAALLVLAGVTVVSAMPSTTFWARDGDPTRVVSNKIFPQAWGFFTKEPGSDNAVPYQVTHDGFVDINSGPQSDPENLVGLSRTQRAQGTEVAILTSLVDRDQWVDCESQALAQCLTRGESQDPTKVVNEYESPTVCGDVEIVIQNVTPWVYREQAAAGAEYDYGSVTHLEVGCPHT